MTTVERTPVVAAAHLARVCHLLDPDYRPMCGAPTVMRDVHYTDPTGPLCDGCGQRLCERCVAVNRASERAA